MLCAAPADARSAPSRDAADPLSGYDVRTDLPDVPVVTPREVDVVFWHCRDLIEELLTPDEH